MKTRVLSGEEPGDSLLIPGSDRRPSPTRRSEFEPRTQTRRTNLGRAGDRSDGGLFGADSVLLEGSHEGRLFLCGLETAVTHLRRSVDELQGDLLRSRTLRLRQQRL